MKASLPPEQYLAYCLRKDAATLLRRADRLDMQGLSVDPVLWEKSVAIVGTVFRVTKDQLLSQDRRQHVAWARFVLVYLLRKLQPDLSFPVLGALINKHHATAIYGYNEVLRRMACQPKYANEIAKLCAQVERTRIEANEQANGAAA